MKPGELLIVGLAYVIGVSLAYAIIASFDGDMNIALGIGALLGAEIGAWLYHRRESAAAPFVVKASVGGLMAILCVLQSILFQALWEWLKYPEVSIPIAAVGTFGFPFALFGTMQKAMLKTKTGK